MVALTRHPQYYVILALFVLLRMKINLGNKGIFIHFGTLLKNEVVIGIAKNIEESIHL